MKKTYAGVIVAAVMMLAGCASTATPSPELAVTVTVTPTAEPTPAALAAPSSPEATPVATDADFISGAHYAWIGQPRTDAEYLGFRDAACAALRAGTPFDQVVVVPGDDEESLKNNHTMVFYASQIACTEFKQY